MFRITVLVAATSPDIKAEVIAASVAARPDMHLAANRTLTVSEVHNTLAAIPESNSCAVVLVGGSFDPAGPARHWLDLRPNLVVMLVDVVGDIVHMGLRDPSLKSVLAALHELAAKAGTPALPAARVAPLQLPAPGASHVYAIAQERSLLHACINWIHAILRRAIEHFPEGTGDVPGYSVTRATLLHSLNQPSAISMSGVDEAALDAAMNSAAVGSEPLAVALRELRLEPKEFRLLLLALAPELDLRYQRCFGFLLDNMSRRAGTIGLCCTLLREAGGLRPELDHSAALARWLAFDGNVSQLAIDEPLRVDPYLAAWLLGDPAGLCADPRLRRVLRTSPWPGATLLQRITRLARVGAPEDASVWTLLNGDDPVAWRAVIEAGSEDLIRVEPHRLAGIDPMEAEDCGVRLSRMAKLGGGRLIVDLSGGVGVETDGEILRSMLAAMAARDCAGTLICTDEVRTVRLLGEAPYLLVTDPALTRDNRIDIVQAAAQGAQVYLSDEAAADVALRYPLSVDAWEHAMRLASQRPRNFEANDPALERFLTASKEIATESVSNLAERIEPVFELSDVVLPQDRKSQLLEIVDHVRLAPKVLDDWKFRDQLPYGQGVAALFSGPSGTGKTMAAMAIAKSLGIQLLRVDLSRVVSKYIGDTEKNIDRIFTDARRSGSALLIDEADALLGKRSEVKDAHDRYANIEVAFLLQRLESYQGLSILTTNMKRNLDGSFLRRIRFIVDFPRPDVDSREAIWRRCLPGASHELRDTDFRQLARRIDLTGGHIRQITLRAAFIAAAAGEKIDLRHVAQGTRAELAKLGMPPVELDLTQVGRAA